MNECKMWNDIRTVINIIFAYIAYDTSTHMFATSRTNLYYIFTQTIPLRVYRKSSKNDMLTCSHIVKERIKCIQIVFALHSYKHQPHHRPYMLVDISMVQKFLLDHIVSRLLTVYMFVYALGRAKTGISIYFEMNVVENWVLFVYCVRLTAEYACFRLYILRTIIVLALRDNGIQCDDDEVVYEIAFPFEACACSNIRRHTPNIET